MSSFPKTEAEIVKFAMEMKTGLAAHAEVFAEPPVAPPIMTTTLDAFQTLLNNLATSKAQVEGLLRQKLDSLETIVEQLKKNLKYAEMVAGGDDEKLKLIGWGVRKSPTPLQPPGPAQTLVVYPQGEGWLELQWQEPSEGGKVMIYKIQRRLRSAGGFETIASGYTRSITLQSQPRGEELDYQIVASNKAGDAVASNIVTVVL